MTMLDNICMYLITYPNKIIQFKFVIRLLYMHNNQIQYNNISCTLYIAFYQSNEPGEISYHATNGFKAFHTHCIKVIKVGTMIYAVNKLDVKLF